ncbi:MAG: response regulator [Planctomycetota bacterium]|jgi:DNA-binding NarL/FixJ family response regulator
MAEPSPFSRSDEKALESSAIFLEKLVKVIKHVQLYPSEHPYIKQGLSEILEVLSEIFAGLSEFSVGAGDDNLLFEEKQVDTSPQTKKNLLRIFNRANLKSLTFLSRITAGDLLEFAKVISMKPDELKAAGGIEKAIAEVTENIRLNTFEYKRMKSGTMELLSGEESELLSDKMQTSVLTSYLAKKLREKAEKKSNVADGDEYIGDETREMQRMLDPTESHPELIATSVSEAVRGNLADQEDLSEEAVKDATIKSLDKIARMFTSESTSWLSSKDLLVKVILMLDKDLQKALLGESAPEKANLDSLVDRLSIEARSDLLVCEMKAGRLKGEQLRKALDNLSRNENDREELIHQVHVAVEHGEFAPETRVVILENLDSMSAIARGEKEKEDFITPTRPPMRIFVADKDHSVLAKLKELLKMNRHVIKATDNGNELLDWLLEEKPDLVIMDVKLEEKHGLEVLENLRRRRLDHIPVIVYTDMAKPTHELVVRRYSRLEWITKDMAIGEFAGQINLYQNAPRVWLFGMSGKRREEIVEVLPMKGNVMVSEFDSLFDLAHDLATEVPDCIVLSATDAGAPLVIFMEFLRSKPIFQNTPVLLIDADRTQSSLRPLLAFKHLRFIPGGLRTSEIAARIIELLGRAQAEHGLQPRRY